MAAGWGLYKKLSRLVLIDVTYSISRGIDVTRNLSRFSKIIPPGNDQPNIVEEEAPSRLACQYCEMVCFCSSGKLHKKPYLNPKVSPHLRSNLIGAKSVADDVQKVTKKHKFCPRFSWGLPIA